MAEMRPILPSVLLRTQSDTRLVALTRQGHEPAFEVIVERYRRPLHRYCRRFRLPDARAEDVVQQVFLSTWSHLTADKEIVQLRPWLYRVARNETISALRKPGYDYDELRESLRVADESEDALERRAVIRETLAGLAALPERQREALLRTAVQGESEADVAEVMQVSEGAVSQLVYRARDALRAAATAVVPLPLAIWAAKPGGETQLVRERIAELASGGTAGAAALAKGVGVAATVGAIAVSPAAVDRITQDGHPVARGASSPEASSAAGGQTSSAALGKDGDSDQGDGRKGGNRGEHGGSGGEDEQGARGDSGRNGSSETGGGGEPNEPGSSGGGGGGGGSGGSGHVIDDGGS